MENSKKLLFNGFLVAVMVLMVATLLPTRLTMMTDEDIQQIDTQCLERCIPNYLTSLRSGLLQCGEFENETGPWEPCFMECLGVKQADDQDQCFCDYCKVHQNYRGFCMEPGPHHINEDQCEELVCTGKAKFYGSYCGPEPEVMKRLEIFEKEANSMQQEQMNYMPASM